MGKPIVFKKVEEKPFVFDTVTKKAGDDSWTLSWVPEIARFNLNRNNVMVFSDVSSQICRVVARERHQVEI